MSLISLLVPSSFAFEYVSSAFLMYGLCLRKVPKDRLKVMIDLAYILLYELKNSSTLFS